MLKHLQSRQTRGILTSDLIDDAMALAEIRDEQQIKNDMALSFIKTQKDNTDDGNINNLNTINNNKTINNNRNFYILLNSSTFIMRFLRDLYSSEFKSSSPDPALSK